MEKSLKSTPVKRSILVALTSMSLLILGQANAVAQPMQLDSLAKFFPAGHASLGTIPLAPKGAPLPFDSLGRPTADTKAQLELLHSQPFIPEEVRATIRQALEFFNGDPGNSGIEIPDNGPDFTQFYWPCPAERCIDGKSVALGSTIAVPGPADLPLPGAKPGETTFVFTALGTGSLADDPDSAIQINWVNVSNLKYGVTRLFDTGLNPHGPATVSGTAETGSGTIVAVQTGVLPTSTNGGTVRCSFLPTAAVFGVS